MDALFDFSLQSKYFSIVKERLFEKASEHLAHQQQKVAATPEAFFAQHSVVKKNAFK
jgi:hypothetical protein